MAYVCSKCGKKMKTIDNYTRCTFCGARILLKERPNLSKEVSTD
jgi:DNA-directed RNA polymerase subunit RPC12/RpoP